MKISQLPVGLPGDDDYLPIDNGTTNRKTQFSDFDASENNVDFTSEDTETPTGWQTMTVLASGALNSLFNQVSKGFANIRYIWQTIGQETMGTVATTLTGAIAEVLGRIGNTAMGTDATTLTGAIAEHTQALTSENLRAKITGLVYKGAITAFNDAQTGGYYTYASSATNRPPLNAGGTCIVLKNGNFVTQLCFPNRSSSTAAPTFYIRRSYAADTWQDWYQVVPTATS